MPTTVDELTSLPRKELQALVKEHGCCKGNAKTEVMITSLADFFAAQETDATEQVEPESIEQDAPASIEQAVPEATMQDELASEQDEPQVVDEQDEPEVIMQDEPEAITQDDPEIIVQDEPEAIMQESTSTAHTAESLASMSRKELQKLAKEHGCKANGKTAELVESLARVLDPAAVRNAVSDDESDDEQEEEPEMMKQEEEPEMMNDVQRIIDEDFGEESDALEKLCKEVEETEVHVEVATQMLTASVRAHEVEEEEDDLTEAIESLALGDEETIFETALMFTEGYEERVQKFVTEHPHLHFTERRKVFCTLTQHQLPAEMGEIACHLDGPKYKRMIEDFSEFEPEVTVHPVQREMLWCPRTGVVLNRVRHEVIRHLQGKKFAEFKEAGENSPRKANEIKLNGIPTPQGKKTVFADEGDAKTPKYKIQHWNMEDYVVPGQSAC